MFLLLFYNRDMTHVRRFVEVACQQALNAHETEFVSYHDALRTAERIYYSNWKEHRRARGHWNGADEERARRYTLPSGSARKVFDSNVDIQRLLASQDERLRMYRDKLETILASHASDGKRPAFEPVLRDFLDFCHEQNPHAYTWRASFWDVTCVFPGRDMWAIWLCLRDMWPPHQ